MKKKLAVMGMIFCMATPVMAEEVKISGSVELQYRKSSDNYSTEGGDDFKANELYIKLSKEVAENVEAMINIDGADVDNKTGSSSTHKAIEEAQIIFKNVAGKPLTLIFGKDQMPFGQDYEKFLFDSKTHGFEIDKVLGAHGIYKMEGFGSVALGFFERARKEESDGTSTEKDTALTDSVAIKVKANKLIDNLSVEVSYAKTGKDELVALEVDESRISAAAKYKMDALNLHAEYTSISDHENKENINLDVIQIGADFKIGNTLLKARHEMSDDDVDNNDEESRTALGASYYFNKKAFVTAEWEKKSFDGTKADKDELLVGAQFKF